MIVLSQVPSISAFMIVQTFGVILCSATDSILCNATDSILEVNYRQT